MMMMMMIMMMMTASAAWMMRSRHRSSIETKPLVIYEGIYRDCDGLNIIAINENTNRGEVLFQSMMMM